MWVVLVYALMVVLVRLGGKRGLATMNTLDFVVVFLLAGVVENATIGDDTSVLGGAVSAVTLVAASREARLRSDARRGKVRASATRESAGGSAPRWRMSVRWRRTSWSWWG